MKDLEFKSIDGGVMDVDDKSRRVKVAISEVGSKDLDNDVIDPSAFNRTISQRGPQGANLIWHLGNHNPSLDTAIGKFSSLGIEGNKLVGVTTVTKTSYGNNALIMYQEGLINQHSIGFKSLQSETMNKGDEDEYNLIKEVKLYEGSAVLWGANPNTPTMAVGKSETSEKRFERLLKELKKIRKIAKTATFTDEAGELFELRIKYAEEEIKTLFLSLTTTGPAAQALLPVNKEKEFADMLLLLTV